MSFQTVNLMLGKSFLLNCQIFFVTLLLSLPLGLIVSFGTMNQWQPLRNLPQWKMLRRLSKWRPLVALSKWRPISWLSRVYVYLMRSTPLMLQLALVYYLPGFLNPGHMLSRMTAACVAFVLNYAAYFSEIFRGGIQGVPRGQQEAGQVLGMTKSQIFYHVTLLQVIKRIVPPIGNEIITLVKDTSLANFIMVKEIIAMAKEFGNKSMIWPLFYAGVFFLIFNGLVTLALSKTEKKLDYFR